MTEALRADGWMLEAPRVKLPATALDAFQAAFETRDLTHLPPGVPRWLFLEWLAREGWLLHGSSRADIQTFEARTPHDLSGDPFSGRTGVFASSDGLWALMYALRDKSEVKRMLNMVMQRRGPEGQWSTTRYFLSLAPYDRGGEVQPTDGRALLRPGSVYVLPPEGFEEMPPYQWPGVGEVREPQWINPNPVRPVLCVPMSPADFPLPVRTHHADTIDARCMADPWGFPWLD
ncbi:hypothetical protein [Deinococcus sp. QL22]|uniref:hypothetical protein n=1 Tax=Deinococcus sp. QL22 TaxID=2939437 RepID=UPI002017CCEA|nr:hypothetical protein [Deinococcus sp. QL22]UQN05157.1 hypothetical protein M1R55_09650 [Deinococcus sp. QL22]